MRNCFKKSVVIALVFSLICSFAFAKGSKENSSVSSDKILFTDDLNRTVELDKNLTRIAPSGNMATVILLTFDPSLLTGLSRKIDYSYFSEDISHLPVYGALYSTGSSLNKEEVLSSHPQVIIDIGEIKGSTEKMTEDLDNLSNSLSVPTVFVKSNFDDIAHTYRKLGELLGKEKRGEELAEYAEISIKFAEYIRSSVKTPKTYYYSTSADGLQSFGNGNLHIELFDKIGVKSIVSGSPTGNVNVSLEEIFRVDPDVIILENAEAYKTVTNKDSRWSNLRAVKNGDVYLVPNNIYSWIDSPPSVNRLLGVYYLADIFYPELVQVDIKAEAKKYFQLFYGFSFPDNP